MGARLGLVACVVAGSVIASPARSEATTMGTGLFVAGRPVPMVSASIEIDVRLGVAHGVVRQRFHNVRPDAIEAVYVFPLPTGATVEGMEAKLGGVTITGAIARRADASASYQAAVSSGHAAALTEAERPGVFTQSIAPVPAGGDVEITLRWQAALTRRDGTWELAHPLVVGPRYVPGQATGKPTAGGGVVPDTDRAPDASRITPPSARGGATPYRLRLVLDDADAITSSHTLAITRDGATATIVLDDARGDRELVVRWASRKPGQVRAVAEPDGNGGAYVAVLVEAEPAAAPAPRTARRWIVAIDRSPSLDGAPAAAARGVADALVQALGADEPVAIVAIGDAPRFAADHAAARRALAALPIGTSDLTRGLAATLASLPRDPLPEVVVVTDGLVADDAAAIERAVAAGVHVHTVGVGAAPNRWLLGAIAARTGATVNVVGSIDDAAAIAAAIASSDRAAPVTVDWRSPAVAEAEATSPQLAPGGATLLVAVDPTGVPRGEVVVAIGSRKLRAQITTVTGTTLAATWAALRVQRLYAAGDREGATRLALERGVIAPTTALVAVVATAGDPVRSTITVPVPLPAGTRRNGILAEQRDGLDDDRGDGQPKSQGDELDVSGAPVGPADARPPTTASGASEDAERAPRSVESVALADSSSVLGRTVERYLLTASLGVGARLDVPAPAALASFGYYRVIPRAFAAGLRLDLTAAPTDDDPVSAATLLSLSTLGRGLLRLDLGVGVGYDGDFSAAYQLGVFAGRAGVGLSLRLTGLAGPETRSTTLGLGVEAGF